MVSSMRPSTGDISEVGSNKVPKRRDGASLSARQKATTLWRAAASLLSSGRGPPRSSCRMRSWRPSASASSVAVCQYQLMPASHKAANRPMPARVQRCQRWRSRRMRGTGWARPCSASTR